MASSLEFVRYAAEQMGAAGEITYKRCLANTEFTVMVKLLV